MRKKQPLVKKLLGVSLLEIMLALVIGATVLLAATRFFLITSENARISNATSMIQQIADASFKWFEANPSFTAPSFNFQTLVAMRLLPEPYFDPTEQKTLIKNPWGGDIDLVGVSPEHFTVTMFNTPAKPCNKLAAHFKDYSAVCRCTKKSCAVQVTF